MAENKEKKTRQKLSSIIGNNLYMLRKVARYTPDYFLWMIVEGIIWGLINSAASIFRFNLLNAVSDGSDFLYAVTIIGIMALFYILAYAFDQWYWQMHNPLMRQKLHLRMHSELFEKARSIDLSCFDDPEFYNDFVWAMNESDGRAAGVTEDTGKLINRIVASFSLFGMILTIDPVIALIILASSAITIVCNLIAGKIGFAQGKETNPMWRKKGYINRVYQLPDYAKELRISDADSLLMKEYDENCGKMKKSFVKYGKKFFLLYGIASSTLEQLTFFAIILYMIYQLKNGSMEIGAFAATTSIVWSIRWVFSDLVERLTAYPNHSLFIEKYREFLRFEPRVKGELTDLPPFESLEFRNVSFSYEFSAHPKYRFREGDGAEKGSREALRNVSMKITAGDKIAIVGYNGAGKTTLIKLMMRLYDPTEGAVLYNGVDIKQYDPQAYRRMIGTVFQDYRIFAASIAENVKGGIYNDETDRGRVEDALDRADFTGKLNTLEDGIYTKLTREFDEGGTNLSGGEAQKVAIARVFAADYPIVIMDEPSSALDPMAEYKLNRSILDSTQDKTVVFISHRLSTTRIADKIYMFDGGHLTEEGSHEELLARGGKYAEMYRLQSEKYQSHGA